MRDDDIPDPAAARRDELRDIHHRIDSLKEENERQFQSLTKDLHALEVAVARGTRFPAAAWISALGLALVVVGQAVLVYSKLETTQMIAIEARNLINEHTATMSERGKLSVQLEERIKSLETRIVGIGPNGWHRPDHEEYAKRVDVQFSGLQRRLDAVEGKQEEICERIRNCGGSKR